jgi:gluconolactonase
MENRSISSSGTWDLQVCDGTKKPGHIGAQMINCLFTISLWLFLSTDLFSQPSLIVEGLKFTEGPCIGPDGKLYFSDVPAQRIYTLANRELSVFLEETGGANGLYFDPSGNLIACAGKARRLISISPDRSVKILVDNYHGKKLNSPNDLWIDLKGGIYFTDPRYGSADNLEQDGMHVYYFVPRTKKTIRVVDDLVRPNGIAGTPDGEFLYVVDQGEEKTYRYDVNPDGTLEGKMFFAPVGTDGMTLDEQENVYITHQKSVKCYSPLGELLETYSFDALTTNAVFYNNGLYVTTQAGQVYRVELNFSKR